MKISITALTILLLSGITDAYDRSAPARGTDDDKDSSKRRGLVKGSSSSTAEAKAASLSAAKDASKERELSYYYYVGSGKGMAYGKGDVGYGKGDMGKGSYGKGDMGKGYYGKGDMGKGDMGKGSYGKGDMGKGSFGKGGMIPAPECFELPFYFYNEDFVSRVTTNANGGPQADSAMFYSTETGQPIGYYSSSSTSFASTGECIGNGIFSFGMSPSFPSQIIERFTCSGESNKIVGGTGDYACANGYSQLVYSDETISANVFVICADLCPLAA